MVNVLDVPIQGKVLYGGSRNISSSSLDSTVFTLDPKDKYLPPGVRRASTTTAVHPHKTRLPATTRTTVREPHDGSIETEIVRPASKTSQDAVVLERQRSLLSIFHRMRQTKSAGSSTESTPVWPRKGFSQAGQPAKQDMSGPIPQVTKPPDRATSLLLTKTEEGLEMPIRRPSTGGATDQAPRTLMVNLTGTNTKGRRLRQLPFSGHSQSALPQEREEGLEYDHPTSSFRNSKTSFLSSHSTPLDQLRDNLSHFTPTLHEKGHGMVPSDHLGRLNLASDAEETLTHRTKLLLDEQSRIANASLSTESFGPPGLDFQPHKDGYAESFASYATSANFSPYPASNTTQSGPTSSCHLSQPETPVMSEFEGELLLPLRDSESLPRLGKNISCDHDLLLTRPSSGAAPPRLPRPQGSNTQNSSGGFQGYSPPDPDHASLVTIRKLPSITLQKTTDRASPFAQQSSKQDLVRSWNDGSQHRVTALGELVDDLGYLGRVII